MPALPPETDALLVQLRSHLAEVFREGQAELWTQQEETTPLLLLKLQSEVAAFAVANGNPKKCYEDAYPQFKKLYASKQNEWDSLNLSFVLCLARRNAEYDSFYSELETDAYFCRKFVISLEDSPSAGLAALPFIPLERAGAFQRPPSAQTLFQRMGIPALLCRYIVQPQQRSADGIVEDCLGGRFGQPPFESASQSQPERNVFEAHNAVRLMSVTIENFRAYTQPQLIDLDADVVVFYGPNGFGKTSLFDSIDFAATGEIGRLQFLRDERFKKAAANLNAAADASSVTMVFQHESKPHEITRTVAHRKAPLLDGRPVKTKQALEAITRAHHPAGGEHVKNLVSLFRATHLFSQAAQELTHDFQKECKLPADVVSRMLAFEDYRTANKKVADVLDILKKLLDSQAKQGVEWLSEQDAKRARLQRLQSQIEPEQRLEVLSTLVEQAKQEMERVGIEVGSGDVAVATVREWRALLDARIQDSRSRREQLTSSLPIASEMHALTVQLTSRDLECTEKTADVDEADTQRVELERVLQESARTTEDLASEQATCKERAEMLAWLRRTRPVYDQSLKEKESLTIEISTATSAVAEQQAIVDSLVNQLTEIEAERLRVKQQLESEQKLSAAIESLEARYVAWQETAATILELERQTLTNQQQVTTLQGELATTRSETSHAEGEVRRLEAAVEDVERTQSELQNLLGALEALVAGPECPLCGVHHGSREELQRRIHAQRQPSMAAAEAHQTLQTARRVASSLAQRADEVSLRLQDVEQAIVASTSELHRLQLENNLYKHQVQQAGFDAASPRLTDELRAEATRLEQRSTELSRTVESHLRAIERIKAQSESERQLLSQQLANVAAKQRLLEQVDRSLQILREEAVSRQLSLDVPFEQLYQLENSTEQEIAGLNTRMGESRKRLESSQAAAAAASKRSERLRAELLDLVVAVSSMRHRLSGYQKQLEQMGLPIDVMAERITELANDEVGIASNLTETRQATLNLEVALDAVATSASMAELSRDLQAIEELINKANQDSELENLWLQCFEQLRATIEREEASAVRLYTERGGQLTSIIQRRLRAVYGFGDIILKPVESSIAVRVRRGDEELPPTDYFSESQQQSLLLSIFLTVCSTQTWSAFAPVLLDDPVTHFDDLNTYSFLDLLAGLLDSDFGKRQFIVSTCEERLFQLARQKLQHLGDRAKFYSLKSNGRQGPVLEKN